MENYFLAPAKQGKRSRFDVVVMDAKVVRIKDAKTYENGKLKIENGKWKADFR